MKIRQKTPATLPKIEPIVPVARPQAFNDPAWLFEPKYDGFRGLVYLTGQRCTIYSKRGNAFSRGHVAYAAFDILWLRGRDLRHLPLVERKRRLERLLPATVGPLNRVPSFEEHGRELFEAACRLDLEGIVAKRKADPYGTGTAWYKIKNPAYTRAVGRRELFER